MYKLLCRDSELTMLLAAIEKQGAVINRFSDGGLSILEDWKNNRGVIMFAASPQKTIILNPRTNLPEKIYKVQYTAGWKKAMSRNMELQNNVDKQLDPKDLGRELDKETKH